MPPVTSPPLGGHSLLIFLAEAVALLGTALLLGSWWGVALVPLLVGGLAPRAVFEERFLAARLEGYADYAARVRWRFVPGLW